MLPTKKIKTSNFYKNKKVFQTDYIDVHKLLVSKKKHMAQRIHLNTLLDSMIMTLLDHCLRLPQMSGYVLKIHFIIISITNS